ncbi:MAG TPA: hypothetical protein VIM70_06485 [Clostridium sp.]|uniref:hypothetical protein n=1 Tax=Clostridium sp. TaxID=1506 RepID=UPI002F91CEAD
MLTSRDKLMIYHIEKYGFITIAQAYSIWWNDRKYGYDLARKRLNQCILLKQIKGFKPVGNIYAEKIFYIETKYATPTKSMIISMNIYAELIRQGAGMIHFKREESWFNGDYRSDAFTIVSLNNSIYSACIEVIDTTKLSYSTHKKALISKYEDIYNNDETVKKLMEITNLDRKFSEPKLIIISEILPKENIEIDEIEIMFLVY